MNVIEVSNKQTVKEFHNSAKEIYKNDPNWTCPLDIEIESIFNPNNNKCFQHGDAVRWILKSDDGKVLGRVAVFYDDNKANKNNDQSTGGMGFFECVNDKAAAFKLFDTAKAWLQSKGMEAMDGPVNFGENFNYWGLLVDGFAHQGYGMQYHHPYYQAFFEEYGFKTYFEQYSYHVDLTVPFPDRQVKFAKFIGRKKNFTFEHFKFANKEKYLKDIVHIYNAVWSDFHEDYTPFEYDEIEQMLNDAKPIIKDEFIWFTYDNGEPIAMIIIFPDVNQVFKKLKNGKLNLLNKLKFLLHKNNGTITRARQVISGVVPEHQRTGIIGPLFIEMTNALKKHKIKELEMSWVGDYNATVNKIYKQLSADKAKTHITYRYLFDRNAEFKRFTNETSAKNQKMQNNNEE